MTDKKALKKRVHHLKPVVMIGGNGLTDAVQAEIEKALIAHELIKIKIATDDRAELKQLAATICAAHDAELIASIGHVIAIYRANEDLATS